MVYEVPEIASAGEAFGSVYSLSAVMKLLGLSEAEVGDLVWTDDLLALPVEDSLLFPSFQFEGHEIRQDIIEVAQILSKASDVFSAAQWLHSKIVSAPNPGRLRAFELLKTDSEAVRQAALETADRWSA